MLVFGSNAEPGMPALYDCDPITRLPAAVVIHASLAPVSGAPVSLRFVTTDNTNFRPANGRSGSTTTFPSTGRIRVGVGNGGCGCPTVNGRTGAVAEVRVELGRGHRNRGVPNRASPPPSPRTTTSITATRSPERKSRLHVKVVVPVQPEPRFTFVETSSTPAGSVSVRNTREAEDLFFTRTSNR